MDKPKKSFVSIESKDTEIKTVKDTMKETNGTKSDIDRYIDNFNPLEKIAYEIAKSRLKTSFDIEKSIGYIKK
jgi:hypothetical protein